MSIKNQSKPQTATFGSLVTHQKQGGVVSVGNGNIVLDLAKLKNVNGGNNMMVNYQGNNRNHVELCTIEESKRSELLHDSESYNNAGPRSHTIEAAGGQNNTSYHSQPRFDQSRPGSSSSIKLQKATKQNSWH